MALAISLLTISTASFFIAAFMHNFAYGLFWSLLIHVIHFMVFGSGYVLPFGQVFANYFWSTLLFGIAGWVLAVMFKIPAFLNGAYYSQVFNEKFRTEKESKTGPLEPIESSDRWKTFGKFLLPFVLIVIGHVVYELNISGFPKWAGGIVLIVMVIIAWVVFYFMFRDKENRRTVLFNSSDPNSEVLTIMFHMLVAMLIFDLTYFIFQAVDCPSWSDNSPDVFMGGECSLFYTDQWYFYTSLIVGGFLFIWALAVGFYARSRGDTETPDKGVNREYRPLKPFTD